MDLRKQVINVEQAKELKELGVYQESIWSWFCDEERDDTPVLNLSEPLNVVGGVGYYTHQYSAFTVAELGELLPRNFPSFYCGNDLWRIGNAFHYATSHDKYKDIPTYKGTIQTFTEIVGITEASVRANLLIFLIKEKIYHPKNTLLTQAHLNPDF
jgi:hypothetical protein